MGTSREEGFEPYDDYLDWGLATDFRFLPGDTRAVKPKSVGLLIQWNSPADAKRARAIADSHGVVVPEVYAGGRTSKVRLVWSVSVPVENAAAFIQAANPLATLIELSTPVSSPVSQPRAALEGLKSNSRILAAVLDDGCAFANSRFLSSGGPRTLWLWNQDPEATGFPLDTVSGPSQACDFGYGGQWSQGDVKTLITQKGSQELVYAAAGLSRLRRAAAHGAHVTDLLCGAEDWQFVFVQFPFGVMTAREPARYGMTYVEERRDRVLGVMVRIHTRPAGRIDVEPVAGVAAVAHDRWSTTVASRPWLPPDQAVDVGPRIRYDTLTGAAFVGGVDVRIGASRVAVVPGFRVRAVTRGEDLVAYYPGVFPRWTIGGGVCVRVGF